MCLGIPGKIIEVYEANGLRMGKIDFGGVTREACLDYVPEADIGDYTIIHVGFAISKVSEEEAQETLKIIREIADIGEELALTEDERNPMRTTGR
jgi:hydrogenase expression/formation protein HypC